MTKTISQRVLELSVKNGVFNRTVARKSFRNYTPEGLHNSVMRRARELSQNGMLTQTGAGEYKPTKRGRSAVTR